MAFSLLTACGTSDEQVATYGADAALDAMSATGGASGLGGGAATGGGAGIGGASRDGGAGTVATGGSGVAGSDGGAETGPALDARGDACGIGCTPRASGALCQGSAVLWECTVGFDFQKMIDGGCTDTGTALIRYCCPATFLPECL